MQTELFIQTHHESHPSPFGEGKGVRKRKSDPHVSPLTSHALTTRAINQALTHANQVHESWSHHAYNFLLHYIKTHSQFMTEDLRKASEGTVAEPPSKRAWGGIIRKAAHNHLIKPIGIDKVTNPKAHQCFAAVWEVN